MRKRYVTGLLLFVLIVIASIPLFHQGMPNYAHDLHYHLNRIDGLAKSLQQHSSTLVQLYWNQDRGYAVGAFYANAFLYPSALLRMFGYSVTVGYKWLLLQANILTVLIGYFSFTKIFQSKQKGLFATFLYVLAPYRLIDLYLRFAVGEIYAIVFIPLVILGIASIYRYETKGKFYLGLGLAGICYSHMLMLLFIIIFLVLYGLLYFSKTFQKSIFLQLVQGSLLGIAISAIFLTSYFDFSNNELFMHVLYRDVYQESCYLFQLFQPFQPITGLSLHLDQTSGEMPFFIGLHLCIGVFGFVWKKTRKLTLLAIVAIWLMTKYFPYKIIQESVFYPLIQFIQYPWRFGVIVMSILVILSVFVIFHFPKSIRQLVVVFAIVLGISIQVSYMNHSQYTNQFMMAPHYFAGSEFLPANIDFDYFGQLHYENNNVIVKQFQKDNLNIHIEVENPSTTSQFVTVPLTFYKQYQVYDEKHTSSLIQSDRGLLSFEVPASQEHTYSITLKRNRLLPVSYLISIVVFFISLFKLFDLRRFLPVVKR